MNIPFASIRSVRAATVAHITPPATSRISAPAGVPVRPLPRPLPARPATISRRGVDHGWVGLVLLACVLLLGAAPRAQANDPLDQWTHIEVPDTVMKTPTDLIHAQGRLWATGTTGRIQYSDNRTTWHVVQTPASVTLRSIIHADGRFVAVGDKLTILSSPNGTDWEIHATDPASTDAYLQIIHADGRFVAVGGRGLAAYSTNGVNWTPVTMPNVNMRCTGVTWGNGLYVAAGELDGYYCIATSPDAATWTRRYVAVGWGYKAVGFFNGLFIAGNVSELATSPDGTTWTRVSNPPFQYSNTTVRGIRVINGRLLVYGSSGLIMSSAAGTDWTRHTTNTTYAITALAYDGERAVLFRSGIVSSGNGPAQSAPWASVGGGDPDSGNPGNPGGDPGSPGTGTGSSIANISTRAWIGTGDAQLVSGFVIQGSGPKSVLIRAIGPTLGGFGVPDTLADPQVRLLNQAGAEIAANNDWGAFTDAAGLAQATATVGAFPLAAGSKDAAMLVTLQPGLYTTQVTGVGAGTGVALVEIYDVSGGATARLVNISSRGWVGSGANVAIPGFVVAGDAPRTLLIRGVGPTLGSFGVADVLGDPGIALLNSSQATIAQNDNWGTLADQAALAAATSAVGAFPLTAGSADAAILVTVQPGAYTVIVSGAGGGTGNALVEVYEVP